MDFIEAAKGIKENRAFKRMGWNDWVYLVQDRYGDIKLYDYHETEDYVPKTEDVLAGDWEECEKQTWYVIDTENHYHLVSDDVTVYYSLSLEEAGNRQKRIRKDEAKEWAYCINIKPSSQMNGGE